MHLDVLVGTPTISFTLASVQLSYLKLPYFLLNVTLMMKVYPRQQVGGVEADMMAANELNVHAFLQVRYHTFNKRS